MLFAKNMQNHPDGEIYCTEEYELLGDGPIHGELEFGPYTIFLWEYPEEGRKGKQSLCLRVKRYSERLNLDLDEEPSEKGFYGLDTIPEEITVLTSLFLRRIVEFVSITRENDRPIRYGHRRRFNLDCNLIDGDANLAHIEKYFIRATRLTKIYLQKFMLASSLYHSGILNIETRPDIAYLNLVSAIETLCNDTEVPNISLREIDRKLYNLICNIEDDELKNQISARIINREKRIKQKFIKFILDHTRDCFWGRMRPEPPGIFIERDNLKSYLSKIYDQRSRTLHTGEPFPPYIFDYPTCQSEVPLGVYYEIHNRIWRSKDYIPCMFSCRWCIGY